MQDEIWVRIAEFPGYSVSDAGRVRSDKSGKILTPLTNQSGIVSVGLFRDSVQYKRSVSLLVGSAFIPKTAMQRETFHSLINLDGDKSNNNVPNLMWRPKWFAVKYFRQFHEPPQGIDAPIMDTVSGEIFQTSWIAALTFGLLDKEILRSIAIRTYVWPTFQTFRTLD